ncbi:tether containing UBX domain for GLUT4 [Euwallacea fornicatus]|uniref:tether containing UBX domain for GLUT4 n=1 Tax=Euwallacea fornicatus TaxID=995702 RepID=UPI00338DD2F3
MSGTSVVVLAPNGRRQTVKCTPNTTILQIIEEVCRKQGVNPIEYDVKHHSKVLDTTHSFRFSGLPNNACLELVAAKKNREEGDVALAVNLENGTRITDTFSPNTTLLCILKKVCPENAVPDKNPVVIYTRREIYGQELEACTLRSLGLIGGRAMIRVLNRNPELLKQQANVSTLLPSKPTEEKPFVRKFQSIEPEQSPQADNQPGKTSAEPDSLKHDYGVGHSMIDSNIQPQNNMKNPGGNLLKLAREKRKSSENFPENSEKGKKKLVQTDPVDKWSIEEEFVFCGERNGMVFSLESAHSVPSEDLPDEFFELTIDDAKKILRDIKRMRHDLENRMLKTSHLRELEESKKQLRSLNKYKRTIIRVQFPDRTVIQGTFKPMETVRDVLEFIRGYLENQNLDFYLYSTPPKSILCQDNKLIEIGCVPGALLYFGAATMQRDGFLKKELQDKFTSNSIASLAAARIRYDNTRKIEETDEEVYMDTSSTVDNSVNYASTSSDTTERKVISNSANYPKWFKPL